MVRTRLWSQLVVLAVVLAACGGSGGTSGTTYWRANFKGGLSLYISVVRSGEEVAGWAKYGEGTFQHYDGTVNSDGTYSVSAYGGATFQVSGNTMTVTTSEGSPDHYVSISESEYRRAGGPT